jgi:rRNA maturation endonuclease Nob1
MANKITTRLKCKPCHLFYKDDGTITECQNCGGDLKRIRVHHVTIKNVTIPMKKTKVKV